MAKKITGNTKIADLTVNQLLEILDEHNEKILTELRRPAPTYSFLPEGVNSVSLSERLARLTNPSNTLPNH